jgi:hypothetical protein
MQCKECITFLTVLVVLQFKKSSTIWAVCASWVIFSKQSLVTTTMHAIRRMYHFPYHPVLPVVLHNKESIHSVHTLHVGLLIPSYH